MRRGSSLDKWRSRMWWSIHGREVECLSPEEVDVDEREVERDSESRVAVNATSGLGPGGGILEGILRVAVHHQFTKLARFNLQQ